MNRPARISSAATATVAVGICAGQMCALKAAGINVMTPSGGDAFTQLVATLEGNLDWLIVTVVGLVLTAVVALLLFGSQRAPDHVFRILAAIALLVVGIPAILR